MLKLAGFNSTIYSFNKKTGVSFTPNLANHVNAVGNTAAMVAAAKRKGNALKELVSHQSIDLDILDRGGRSLNQIANWFVSRSHFHFCLPILSVPPLHLCHREEGRAIVNEAIQKRARRAEEDVSEQHSLQIVFTT